MIMLIMLERKGCWGLISENFPRSFGVVSKNEWGN